MISIEKVRQAAKMIKGKVIKTPLVYSPSLSHMFGGEIYLKLENLQKTGSFKIRGATYSILINQDGIGPGRRCRGGFPGSALEWFCCNSPGE